MGLHGDCKVELVTGPTTITDLRRQLLDNPDYRPLAICWTGQCCTLTRIIGIRRLGLEQTFSVELDDQSVLRVSPSSEFVLRSGVTKDPTELEPGDSLLPLYLGEDHHGYPTYQIPGRTVSRKLSRLAAEWKLGHPLDRATYVEHIDGNRKNYHPDNLRITFDEKKARRSFTPKVVKIYKETQALFEECAAASPRLAKIVGRRKKRKGKKNHKVMSSTPGVLEEVFTLIAESECSLSISGVFLSLPS